MSDSWPVGALDPLIEALQTCYIPDHSPPDIAGLVADRRLGRMAIVSSFGTESAVLLHLMSRARPDADVLFLDTLKHFPETHSYVDEIATRLSLNLRVICPDPALLADEDPDDMLWENHPDGCCRIRKVIPLQDALDGYDSWVSGQKRYQSVARAAVPLIERDGIKIKLNPLALWTAADISRYFTDHNLPPHPLVAQGFPSIGCAPCSRAVRPGEDPRAGRWAHTPEKTECGIHLGPDGRFRRG
ncbi:phosphoadenylyl-sulfate reductase [Paracoccus pacificus]|uniref:Adenosine 5'-phosphosulfate reductase n=1 Tax=Paracoccus pacificus TaxID=1463598 RepID=A0ABW4R664_9RHOB